MSFRVRDYCRRELDALRRVMTDDEIRELVTVPPHYLRWLEAEGKTDPVFRRQVKTSYAYRQAMLEAMENG